jgi:hypothetical protein
VWGEERELSSAAAHATAKARDACVQTQAADRDVCSSSSEDSVQRAGGRDDLMPPCTEIHRISFEVLL